jgi:hypothetical protein
VWAWAAASARSDTVTTTAAPASARAAVGQQLRTVDARGGLFAEQHRGVAAVPCLREQGTGRIRAVRRRPRVTAQARTGPSPDDDTSCGGGELAGEQPPERPGTAPPRAHDGEQLTAPHRDRHAADEGQPAPAVAHPLRPDHHAHTSAS